MFMVNYKMSQVITKIVRKKMPRNIFCLLRRNYEGNKRCLFSIAHNKFRICQQGHSVRDRDLRKLKYQQLHYSSTCEKLVTGSNYDHRIRKDRLSCHRNFSTLQGETTPVPAYLDVNDPELRQVLLHDMIVRTDFVTEEEEQSLLGEVDKYMRRLRYEFDHWDNAIHGYRETEKRTWDTSNELILQRVRDIAFTSDVSPLAYVHVLDIAREGYIKPHVDAVRFCGDTITGISLLSSCVMRLALESDSGKYADVHLPRRSLYIMRDRARYDFTHEVLKEDQSYFKGQHVPRDRRISVICRNEPTETATGD